MEVTMISRRVEISIAAGVAETEDANYCDRFFFLFFSFSFLVLNHMHLFKVQRQSSSVSSTHPAIEISTLRDYHHSSFLHPPSWIRPRGWRHTSSTLSFS